MENIVKYNTAFTESFGIDESALNDLEYESILEWDSVAHMGLIAGIEEAFDIELKIDIDKKEIKDKLISSFEKIFECEVKS